MFQKLYESELSLLGQGYVITKFQVVIISRSKVGGKLKSILFVHVGQGPRITEGVQCIGP